MEEETLENSSRKTADTSETLTDVVPSNALTNPLPSYPWTAYDPIVLQQRIVPIASEAGSSRMDVLSPSNATLSRSRSLTRPERRTQATSVPRHKSNILTEATSEWGPWSIFFHAVTFCLPSVLLSRVGGMHELDKQRAWREKVALCLICAFFCGLLGFITFGLQETICKTSITFPVASLSSFGPPTYLQSHGIVVNGIVYDISSILSTHNATSGGISYFQQRPSQASSIQNAAGVDASPFFRHTLSAQCQQSIQSQVRFECSSPAFPGITYCHDWNRISSSFSQMSLGPVVYQWQDVFDTPNFIVFDGKVLNLTGYISSNTSFFGQAADTLIKGSMNTDVTKALLALNDGSSVGQCLIELYKIGSLEGISTGCWTAEVILYVSFVIVMGLVMVRFAFAIYFRWFISNHLGKILKDSQTTAGSRKKEPVRKSQLDEGHFPITMTDHDGNLILKHTEVISPMHGSLPRRSNTLKSRSTYGNEVHTIMLVTCYSEDDEALRLTFDALAETEYNEDFKLLLIIADGLIKGHGSEKTTPDLILDLLELDSNWREPEPMSYLAVADGAKQHNKAKVYVAWYNHNGRSVPTILIVKCGLANEIVKPGNRGKRDSQMIMMRFLERISFNQRLCPLEYDMFLKMNYLMGLPPDCFQIVLMVDADTKVAPDSLARMVACMVSDPSIMGLCGETRIANKNDSWVSRIQVFEYYLSHHLTKAFESMFGGVTCLPGCFCMYRIKAKKGDSWIPILCSPEIITTYSQSVVDTLHKKNLLHLGEDRFLTTLMLRAFPRRKLIFVPRAFCKTTVPNTFAVLLSQRRRWINSTIHNLMELLLVNELCGIFCFSMQFVIFLELIGTVTLPAAICFTMLLIVKAVIGDPQVVPLILLGAILGLPAILILLTTRRVVYIYWMFIYLLALPIWNFVLPTYAFWHFDDFSWGQTRKLAGGDIGHGFSDKSEIGPDAIPLRRWDEWERDRRANIVISYRRRNRMVEGTSL